MSRPNLHQRTFTDDEIVLLSRLICIGHAYMTLMGGYPASVLERSILLGAHVIGDSQLLDNEDIAA